MRRDGASIISFSIATVLKSEQSSILELQFHQNIGSEKNKPFKMLLRELKLKLRFVEDLVELANRKNIQNKGKFVKEAFCDRVRAVLTSNTVCTPSNIGSTPLVFTVNMVTAIYSPANQPIHVFPNPAHSVPVINHLDATDQWQIAGILNIGGASATVSNQIVDTNECTHSGENT